MRRDKKCLEVNVRTKRAERILCALLVIHSPACTK